MIGASGRPLVFTGWHVELEFMPRYLWVGVYWRQLGNTWDYWLCLLPCFPVHLSLWYHDPEQ